MEHRKEPTVAHQALMNDLNGVLERFDNDGMPVVERIAVLGQIIGKQILLVEPGAFSVSDLLTSVAGNIAAGNAEASRALDAKRIVGLQ